MLKGGKIEKAWSVYTRLLRPTPTHNILIFLQLVRVPIQAKPYLFNGAMLYLERCCIEYKKINFNIASLRQKRLNWGGFLFFILVAACGLIVAKSIVYWLNRHKEILGNTDPRGSLIPKLCNLIIVLLVVLRQRTRC